MLRFVAPDQSLRVSARTQQRQHRKLVGPVTGSVRVSDSQICAPFFVTENIKEIQHVYV